MRWLKEMVEVVRAEGLLIPDELKKRLESVHIYQNNMQRDFFEYVEKARSFVFVPSNSTPKELEEVPSFDRIEGAPFPVFSIEMSGDNPITSPKDQDEEVYINCILCIETKPGVFANFTYITYPSHGVRAVSSLAGGTINPLIQDFMNRINKEKMGLERVRERVTLGSGSEKRRHTIREVIHISPSVPRASDPKSSREIDWSHRFEVRGHWRRVDTVGKDRDGNYGVEGYTWVREHVRGPEALPLIKKQRVVHEG